MKKWLLSGLACLLTLLTTAQAPRNGGNRSGKSSLTEGQKVYEQYCQTCHQANGAGVPGLNPPLKENEWVNGNKARLINVILRGLQEPIEINGETYNNVMPAHDFLTDQEVADVLTYIRSSFGNKASSVTAEEVRKTRGKEPGPD